jgi:hypothetical protein
MIDTTPGWARMMKGGDFAEHKAILTALYEMAGGPKALDLGTGEAHVTKNFECDHVDLVIRPTAPGKTMQFDIRDAPKKLWRFNYNLLILTDVIEHLLPEDGADLLTAMEKNCGATAIFTPVGPYKLDPTSKDPDAHKSAWTPEQFWMAGWEIIEMPTYHRFEGGNILGAFWAFQFRNSLTPTAEAVLTKAGLSL